MWPNTGQSQVNENRLKEYQRQQERLKAMASNTDRVKSVSADVMIENLLKQSFKKPAYPATTATTTPDKFSQVNSDLPVWLQCESSLVPTFYKDLWAIVQSTPDFADTQKVSQMLLTSGLHTDILGYIWNLSNKAVPGQLNKQEFYMVLALVGLAQSGCTFNNLSVLNLIPSAPIPVLQTKLLDRSVVQSNSIKNNFNEFQTMQFSSKETNILDPLENNAGSGMKVSSAPQKDFFMGNSPVLNNTESSTNLHAFKKDPGKGKEKNEASLFLGTTKQEPAKDFLDVNKSSVNNFPCIGSSPTAELEDDFTDFQSVPIKKTEKQDSNFENSSSNLVDDFTDFQSADAHFADPLETVVITQKREIPRIPLPKTFTGKLANLKSNILKISPESERKLMSLSQSESLSSLPESKISSNNEVSTMPAIPAIGGSRGIGSRLANHSLGTKTDKIKHHQKHKMKPLGNVDDILATSKSLSSANVEEIFPRCYKGLSGPKTFLLKETKIRSNEDMESNILPKKEDVNIIDNPIISHSLNNTRTIEIPMLGTFNETILPAQTVIPSPSMELLNVEEDKYSALRAVDLQMNEKAAVDDGKEGDDFGDFFSADAPLPNATNSEETENWGDWNFSSNPEPQMDSEVIKFENILNTDNRPEEANESELLSESIFSTNSPIQITNETQIKDDHISDNVEKQTMSFEPLGFEREISKVETNSSHYFSSIDLFSLDTNISMKFNQVKDVSPPSLSLKEDNIMEKEVHVESNFNILADTTSQKVDWSNFEMKTEQLDFNNENDFGDFLTPEVKSTIPNELSRRSSVSSLDFKISPTEETEQEVVWRKSLDSCFNLLQEGYDIFNSISIKFTLDEVFSTQETSLYLNNLNLVYNISRRISQNYRDVPSIQEDIQKIWQKLDDFCFEYNIKLKDDIDNSLGTGSQCGVCLSSVGSEFVNQGGASFHPTCANFWVNCVESHLPFSM